MTDFLLLAITFLLLVIAYRVTKIDERFKKRFPTDKEAESGKVEVTPNGP
jgi:hypothetical protein